MDASMAPEFDERADEDVEAEAAGSSSFLGPEGWEAGDYIDPEDDWTLSEDGSYLSPDGTIRSWPVVGPEPL